MIQLSNTGDVTYVGGTYNFDRFLYTLTGNTTVVDGSGNTIIDKNTAGKVLNTPTILTPTDGAIGYTGLATGSNMSIYSTVYTGVHTSSDWEVSTDINFTNIVYSSYQDTVNLTSIPVYGASVSTDYYIRVRYSSNNNTSLWSTPVHYVSGSSYISAPIISVDASTSTPVVVLTGINVVGSGTVHLSTDWVIATDSTFNNVVYSSLGDTVNLTSLTIPIALSNDTTYYITSRVRTTSLTSEYTNASFITINSLPAPIVVIGNSVITGNTLTGTISNYDAANTYIITTDIGTVTDNGNGTFLYTSPAVTVDTNVVITVTATNPLNTSSTPVVSNILVTPVPIVTDGIIINNDFSTNYLIDIGYQVP